MRCARSSRMTSHTTCRLSAHATIDRPPASHGDSSFPCSLHPSPRSRDLVVLSGPPPRCQNGWAAVMAPPSAGDIGSAAQRTPDLKQWVIVNELSLTAFLQVAGPGTAVHYPHYDRETSTPTMLGNLMPTLHNTTVYM